MGIKVLRKEGNFVEKQLKSIIVNKNGKPDRLAIEIYSNLKGWFKPNKSNNFNKSGKFDIRKYGFRTSYEELSKEHNCTKELVRQKIVFLEKLGLISRNFRIEYAGGIRKNNVLHLLLWKETPYFEFEYGLEKRQVFGSNIDKETWKKIENETPRPSKEIWVAPPTNDREPLQENLDIINDNDDNTTHTTIHDNHDNHEIISCNFDDLIINDESVTTPQQEDSFIGYSNSSKTLAETILSNRTTTFKDGIPRKKVRGKDGKMYSAIPLAAFKFDEAALDEIIYVSDRTEFTYIDVVTVIQNILKKQPDKLIYGGRRGFIQYMIHALEGEYGIKKGNLDNKTNPSEYMKQIKVEEMTSKLEQGNEIRWM